MYVQMGECILRMRTKAFLPRKVVKGILCLLSAVIYFDSDDSNCVGHDLSTTVHHYRLVQEIDHWHQHNDILCGSNIA